MRLGADYDVVNKKTKNHLRSVPNMENTLERTARCQFNTNIDMRRGIWQEDPTRVAQELLFLLYGSQLSGWGLSGHVSVDMLENVQIDGTRMMMQPVAV